jgi:hypothetical protein
MLSSARTLKKASLGPYYWSSTSATARSCALNINGPASLAPSVPRSTPPCEESGKTSYFFFSGFRLTSAPDGPAVVKFFRIAPFTMF